MEDIDARLDEVDEAIKKVLEAQEYQIGDRRVLRARLKELQELKKELEKKKLALEGGTFALARFK